MKARIFGFAFFATALLFSGFLISFAVNNFTMLGETTAVVPQVVAAAAYIPVETLCKSNSAEMELCISSDDRGLFTVFDGVQMARYMYVFYDAPGGCPQAMPGYQVRVTDWTLRDLQFFGFDAAEFEGLGVGEYYCTFAPLAS